MGCWVVSSCTKMQVGRRTGDWWGRAVLLTSGTMWVEALEGGLGLQSVWAVIPVNPCRSRQPTAYMSLMVPAGNTCQPLSYRLPPYRPTSPPASLAHRARNNWRSHGPARNPLSCICIRVLSIAAGKKLYVSLLSCLLHVSRLHDANAGVLLLRCLPQHAALLRWVLRVRARTYLRHTTQDAIPRGHIHKREQQGNMQSVSTQQGSGKR